MEVIHRLRSLLPIVDDEAEAVRAVLISELAGDDHHVTKERGMLLCGPPNLRQASSDLWDEQQVNRRLRTDVSEGIHELILVHSVG